MTYDFLLAVGIFCEFAHSTSSFNQYILTLWTWIQIHLFLKLWITGLNIIEEKSLLQGIYIFNDKYLLSCTDNIPQTTSLRHTWKLPACIWRRILYRQRLTSTEPLSSRRTPKTRSFRSTIRFVLYYLQVWAQLLKLVID